MFYYFVLIVHYYSFQLQIKSLLLLQQTYDMILHQNLDKVKSSQYQVFELVMNVLQMDHLYYFQNFHNYQIPMTNVDNYNFLLGTSN